MDELEIISSLARSLQQAANQHNWPKMQSVDAQIATLLATLEKQTLSSAKREAIGELEQVHTAVSRYCKEQSDELEMQMARIRHNQEGSTAYAQFANSEGMGR